MLKLSNEKDSGQQMIYDWLLKQAEKDECLKEKINVDREYTTEELLKYCCEEARKATTGSSACIANETVFEWCKHYILEGLKLNESKIKAKVKANKDTKEEDSEDEEVEEIKEEPKKEVKPKPKKEKKPKEVKPVEPTEEETLFNLFGDADLTGKKTDLF